MKRTGVIVSVVFLIVALAAYAQEDIKKAPSCKYCGMDRDKFTHSRASLEYEDGTVVSVCSLHCAAVGLSMNAEKTPKAIWAAEYNTKRLIDAQKASWVVGGKKPGVMSRRAKFAFEKREDAEKYVKENGGMVAPFDAALKYAFADMYADLNMVREKNESKQKKMLMMRKKAMESAPQSKWTNTRPSSN
jgi:copper chaperone NosL